MTLPVRDCVSTSFTSQIKQISGCLEWPSVELSFRNGRVDVLDLSWDRLLKVLQRSGSARFGSGSG